MPLFDNTAPCLSLCVTPNVSLFTFFVQRELLSICFFNPSYSFPAASVASSALCACPLNFLQNITEFTPWLYCCVCGAKALPSKTTLLWCEKDPLSFFIFCVEWQLSISHVRLIRQLFIHFPCCFGCFFCRFCSHVQLFVLHQYLGADFRPHFENGSHGILHHEHQQYHTELATCMFALMPPHCLRTLLFCVAQSIRTTLAAAEVVNLKNIRQFHTTLSCTSANAFSPAIEQCDCFEFFWTCFRFVWSQLQHRFPHCVLCSSLIPFVGASHSISSVFSNLP